MIPVQLAVLLSADEWADLVGVLRADANRLRRFAAERDDDGAAGIGQWGDRLASIAARVTEQVEALL